MSDLNEAVRAAIAQHMPAAVAGELKAYIEKAGNTERANKSLQVTVAANTVQIADLLTQIRSQTEQDIRAQKMKADEVVLFERELKLLRAEASSAAAIANAAKDATLHVVDLFLKNAQVRTSIVSSVGHPVAGSPPSQYNTNGTAGFTMQTNDSRHETQTSE